LPLPSIERGPAQVPLIRNCSMHNGNWQASGEIQASQELNDEGDGRRQHRRSSPFKLPHTYGAPLVSFVITRR
jgi:hypothetical protein